MLSNIRHVLKTILAAVSVTLFTVLVATTTWQVVSRQILNEPSTWSEELARLLFVWLSFLGSAFLFGERGHIAVDFLARKLPFAGQRVAQIFVQAMVLLFALVGLVWGGYLAASIAWEQNLTALPFTIGWVYLVIPIAGVFIAIFALMDIVGLSLGETDPYPEIEDPVAEPAQSAASDSTLVASAEADATDSKEAGR